MPSIEPRRVSRFARKLNPIVKVIILISMVTGGVMPIKNPSVKIFLTGPSGEIARNISPSTLPRRAPIRMRMRRIQIFFLKRAMHLAYYSKIITSASGRIRE